MTDEQFNRLIGTLQGNFAAVKASLDALQNVISRNTDMLAGFVAANNPAPNYNRRIEEFLTFDWASIDAHVEEADEDGPSIVNWQNRLFIRRTGNPTFGENVLYFSRAIGRDGDKTKYERLITFKELGEARELSRKTAKTVQAGAKPGDSGKLATGQQGSAGQQQRKFSCQPALVQALTKKNDACAVLGVSPEKWKASLKTSELSSDDVRAFTDDQMRRALEIIEDLIVAEQERRAVAEEGEDFSPNF